MQAIPHLHFNGDCEEAFKLYEHLFGAKIDMLMPWSNIPDNDLPAEMQDKITHGSLTLEDGGMLTGSDTPPTRYSPPAGFNVILSFKGIEKAERIFSALSEGGRVDMPLRETFWTARFGMLTDRFGIPWMINASAEA